LNAGLTIPDGRLPSHDDVMFLLRSTTVEERKALIEEFAGSFPLYREYLLFVLNKFMKLFEFYFVSPILVLAIFLERLCAFSDLLFKAVRQSTLSQELGELLSPRFSHLCDVTFILSDVRELSSFGSTLPL
jgi:hypothetical protein